MKCFNDFDLKKELEERNCKKNGFIQLATKADGTMVSILL